MRGAVRNKERWKGRRAPTQYPSTDLAAQSAGSDKGSAVYELPSDAALLGWAREKLSLPPLPGPSRPRILGDSQGPSQDSNETCCV